MTLDASLHNLISLSFTLLLLAASVHKFADRDRFQAILKAYRLLPCRSLPLLAVAVPLLELVLGLAWLTKMQHLPVALATVALIGIYTVAIGINIVRGNLQLDCGCTAVSAARQVAGHHQLSSALLVRNGALMGLALFALLPSNQRELGIFDWLSLGLACSGLVLLYLACHQLLLNRQLVTGWRRNLAAGVEPQEAGIGEGHG